MDITMVTIMDIMEDMEMGFTQVITIAVGHTTIVTTTIHLIIMMDIRLITTLAIPVIRMGMV